MMRIGCGYDVHRLEKDEELVLGGVKIPWGYGLEGHSDADVLLHAIMDAILGAMGEGDIGVHFPPADDSYRGIASTVLLARVADLMDEKGYLVGNVDATVIAQAPKLAPYIPAMEENIAKLLKISLDRVNVKATTTEGLGFIGSGEGIAAQAVILLKTRPKGVT